VESLGKCAEILAGTWIRVVATRQSLMSRYLFTTEEINLAGGELNGIGLTGSIG
jgi:hypothetical protein